MCYYKKSMESMTLKAQYIARSIDLDRAAGKVSAREVRRLRNRTIYEVGDRQYAVIYSFGVLAFLGTTAEQEQRIRKMIRSAWSEPEPKGWHDAYNVEADPTLAADTVEFHCVRLRELTLDHVDLICRALAQSVALSQFDIGVDRMIERFHPIHEALRMNGRLHAHPRDLLRMVGANHTTLRVIIADLAILHAPQVTWSDPQLERLWLDLLELFDLTERFERLEFKVGYLRETTDQLLGMISARRMELMELAIVIFFIIDIVILVLEFLK